MRYIRDTATCRPRELGPHTLAERRLALEQDGYSFRAVEAWPADRAPVPPEKSEPSTAYHSIVNIVWDDEDQADQDLTEPTAAPQWLHDFACS